MKNWLTLNSHGKYCLWTFIMSISANDLLTSQLDYLYNKDLIDHTVKFKNRNGRRPLAGHCLTDLGIETIKHYFPKFSSFSEVHKEEQK